MKSWLRALIIIICFLMISCSSQKTNHYAGYIDADFRYIASDFSGDLVELFVNRGDSVVHGQNLFSLEKFSEESNYKKSLSDLHAIELKIDGLISDSKLKEKKLERRKNLKEKNFAHEEDLEIASNDYIDAKSQLEQAKENLLSQMHTVESSKWTYQKKQVQSIVNGIVFDIFYRPGEYVAAGKPVLSLLAPEDIRILFFVPEAEIAKIRINQPVLVTSDGSIPINAKITYISPQSEFTPPVIYSEDERTKLVFLVEARTDIKTSKEIHPGQPVTVNLK